MKGFLAFIGFVVVAIVVVGIMRGWFNFSVDDNKNLNIKVNGKQVEQDVKEGVNQAKDGLNKFGEKAKDSLKKTESGPAAGTPGPSGK